MDPGPELPSSVRGLLCRRHHRRATKGEYGLPLCELCFDEAWVRAESMSLTQLIERLKGKPA